MNVMSDGEIVGALQELAQEHFDSGGIRFDLVIGQLVMTIIPDRHSTRMKPHLNLREQLSAALQPHLERLVTNKLTR